MPISLFDQANARYIEIGKIIVHSSFHMIKHTITHTRAILHHLATLCVKWAKGREWRVCVLNDKVLCERSVFQICCNIARICYSLCLLLEYVGFCSHSLVAALGFRAFAKAKYAWYWFHKSNRWCEFDVSTANKFLTDANRDCRREMYSASNGNNTPWPTCTHQRNHRKQQPQQQLKQKHTEW